MKPLPYLVILLSLIFSACSSEPKTSEETEVVVEALPDEPHDIEIVISGSDNMMFDKNAFEVTEGQRVKLLFKNIGTLSKQAMGHNLVLLDQDTDIPKFAVEATRYLKNEYIPSEGPSVEKIIGHTKILGPKEQDVFYFTAGAPGKYPYVCTFPGHFSVMQGIMTVKAK